MSSSTVATVDDPSRHLYWYRARCPDDDGQFGRRYRVYDGDTCRLDIDCGFGLVLERRECRLWGIDAPEVNNPDTKAAGLRVRDYLRALIIDRRDLMVGTLKDATDSLGSRYLVKIYLPPSSPGNDSGQWLHVNDHLVARFPGQVVEYMR